MIAYYNEIDPKAAAWLRELIKHGHIAKGVVDERDIRDVEPKDLDGFTQCHFFAGIGVWSYALRAAGWPDSRPAWTGSCPCQPFSAAGKRGGTSDERHLWPAFHHLIRECRPRTIFGEQVASRDGIAWLDVVSADLEGEGYTCGPAVLPACGVGAPHIRSRLWFVADPAGLARRLPDEQGEEVLEARGRGEAGRMAYALPARRPEGRTESRKRPSTRSRLTGGLGHAYSPGARRYARTFSGAQKEVGSERSSDGGGAYGFIPPGPVNGFWSDAEWVPCIDERARAVEPGTFPLAHGAPARVGRLRGSGNAIVAQAAKEFISAYIPISGYTPE